MIEEILFLEKWIAQHSSMHKVQVKRIDNKHFFYIRSSLKDDTVSISYELFQELVQLFDSGSVVFWYQATRHDRDYNSFSMPTVEFNQALTVLSRKVFLDSIDI